MPGAPYSVAVHILDSRTVNITWQPPPEDKRNGVIEGYMIVVARLGQSVGEEYTFNTTELSVVVGQLDPYRSYQCKVAAMTSVGSGAFNTTVAYLPEDGNLTSLSVVDCIPLPLSLSLCSVPSSPPQRVSAEVLGSRAIRVSWDLPPESDRNGMIRKHTIRVIELETGTVSTYDVPSSYSEREIASLHPHYHYNCSVASVTVGTGPYSEPVTIQTDEDGKNRTA